MTEEDRKLPWTQTLYNTLTEEYEIPDRWVMVQGMGDHAIVQATPTVVAAVQRCLEEGDREFDTTMAEAAMAFVVQANEDDPLKGELPKEE